MFIYIIGNCAADPVITDGITAVIFACEYSEVPSLRSSVRSIADLNEWIL